MSDRPPPPDAPAERVAVEEHVCAACGADARWDPRRQALVCPWCGTAAPAALDAEGRVRELPLAATLRELPDERRGWLAAKRSVRCESCHAVAVLDATRVAQRCEFCGSSQLVPYEEVRAPLRPEGVLPFRVAETDARESIRRWLAGRWLAPSGLSRRARIGEARGIYLPYWTFDAAADCPWTAEAGHYHYTTETYRDAQGRRRTRQVRHVRWVPAAGRLQHAFDDEPVPGTHGVPLDLLRAVEPFPTQESVPYESAYVAGFVVEHYRVVLFDAATRARAAMEGKLRALAAAQIPGDTHRNLVIHPSFSGETFKLVLTPVWLLVYRVRERPYRVLVNGSTGRVAGQYPKSPWKIAGVVLLALLAVLVVALLSR